MQDGIIKGTGNSRYIKSAIAEATTWEQFRAALIAGTLPIDLAGINAAGWQQIGMALSKGSLLSDATAAKLEGVETPDAALSLLGRFHGGLGNEYVWSKTQDDIGAHITNSDAEVVAGTSSGPNDTISITIATGYSVDSSGNFALTGTTTTVSGTHNTGTSVMKSAYIGQYGIVPNSNNKKLFHIASNTTTTFLSDGSLGWKFVHVELIEYTTEIISFGYVNSPDSAAYPPSVSDGYTYTPLGQIGSKVQIATGSYTGTGTYGSSNPTVINTGNQNTKILFVFRSDGALAGIFLSGLPSGIVIATDGSTSVQRTVSSDANGIFSIYHATTAAYQFNQSGFTHKFISIG